MAQQWFYATNGQKIGPITATTLQSLAKSGKLLPNDLVWKEGAVSWIAANKVKGLFPDAPTPPPLPTAKPPLAASNEGYIQIVRLSKLTGFLHKVRITIDGQMMGSLGGGFPDGLLDLIQRRPRTITIPVSPGEHVLEVNGGGMNRTATVQIAQGLTSRFSVLFSNLGALGGGLTLSPLEGTESLPFQKAAPITKTVTHEGVNVTSPPQPKTSLSSELKAKWEKLGKKAKIAVAAGGSVVALSMMCCCGIAGAFKGPAQNSGSAQNAGTGNPAVDPYQAGYEQGVETAKNHLEGYKNTKEANVPPSIKLENIKVAVEMFHDTNRINIKSYNEMKADGHFPDLVQRFKGQMEGYRTTLRDAGIPLN